MNYIVTLLNGKTFEADNNKSILESAQANDVSLEYSCLTGRCGTCICTVIKGSVDRGNDQILTHEERKTNKALTCQAKPLSDIKIDIEDLGIYSSQKIKTIPTRISTIELIGDDILSITLRTPPSNILEFIPGQYINLIYKNIRRSYSIANSMRTDGSIDLLVKRFDEGEMSNYLFNSAKVDDLLRIEGPFGTFGWRDNLPNKIIFLATGTGIAPIISLINSGRFDDKEVYVYWGNRFENDCFDLPKKLLKKIRLVQVFSRVNTTNDLENKYVQHAALYEHNDLSNFAVYACGSLNMIEDAKQLFLKKKLSMQMFFSDAFVSSGANQ